MHQRAAAFATHRRYYRLSPQASSAIFAGVIIAFVANWRLALVVCSIFPLMVVSSLMQGKAFKGYAQGAAKSMEESGHIAVEATTAIRTVAAFNLQGRMLAAYSTSLLSPLKSGFVSHAHCCKPDCCGHLLFPL